MAPVHKNSINKSKNMEVGDEDITSKSLKIYDNSYDNITSSSCNVCRLEMIGNNYILLKTDRKLLITVGPHWPGVCVTLAIIFFGTYENFLSVSSLTMRLVVIIFCILTTLFLFLTACSDPGKLVVNYS